MKIIIISSNGIGAGKTTLANQLSPTVLSLADALRAELNQLDPDLPWYDRSQEAKDMLIPEDSPVATYGLTLRDVMVTYGQHKCALDRAYWVNRFCIMSDDYVQDWDIDCIAVDDIRKVIEVETIRSYYSGHKDVFLTHLHIHYPYAVAEPHFENDQLGRMANYTIHRSK